LVTKHAFDRQTHGQTDRQTEFSSLDRVCIACSAVKRVNSIGRNNMIRQTIPYGEVKLNFLKA